MTYDPSLPLPHLPLTHRNQQPAVNPSERHVYILAYLEKETPDWPGFKERWGLNPESKPGLDEALVCQQEGLAVTRSTAAVHPSSGEHLLKVGSLSLEWQLSKLSGPC